MFFWKKDSHKITTLEAEADYLRDSLRKLQDEVRGMVKKYEDSIVSDIVRIGSETRFCEERLGWHSFGNGGQVYRSEIIEVCTVKEAINLILEHNGLKLEKSEAKAVLVKSKKK